MTEIDDTKPYIRYAKQVISCEIVACENIVLACKRFMSWFNRDDIFFDYKDVDKKIKFISLLKHTTGEYNGKHFTLLDWQSWCFAAMFGWKYKDTRYRVCNESFIFITRKNGKSSLAAAIALCCLLCDNEPHAEIDCLANSRKQAHLLFDMIKDYAESIDPKNKLIKKFKSDLKVPKTKSLVQVHASESMTADGLNSSCSIIDEIHAAKTYELYNVMKSSQVARTQPMMIIITTAGFLIGDGYPCYDMRKSAIEVLKGIKQNDALFAAIYELDPDDNWEDENNWLKCCPSLDQTVSRKALKDQVILAKNNISLENGILTKNFNRFCESSTVWIPSNYIVDATHDVNIDEFNGEQCYMGVDLSSISDLTCTSVMFPPNPNRNIYPDKFVFKNIIYLPDTAMEDSPNKELYRLWKQQGYLYVTSGNVVDYDYILKDQLEISRKTYLSNVAYDSWNATQWAINATSEGLPLTPYSQAIGNFNKPTKTFEMLIRQGKIIIDNNPVTRWCFGNVELKIDYNENCKPIKVNNDKTKKIDPIIAMLQALGVYLNEPHYNNIITAV
jgi:phage terminase large subunit-like protein